jgi:hypothetical protein
MKGNDNLIDRIVDSFIEEVCRARIAEGMALAARMADGDRSTDERLTEQMDDLMLELSNDAEFVARYNQLEADQDVRRYIAQRMSTPVPQPRKPTIWDACLDFWFGIAPRPDIRYSPQSH